MLTLKSTTTPAALVTVTLPEGAALFLRPWSTGIRLAAIRAYWKAVEASGDESVGDVAYAVGAVRAGLAGWEGFDTEDAPGQPAEFSRELVDSIEALIVGDLAVYRAIEDQYVRPALAEEQVKNGSSLPRAGGSPAGATSTANPSSPAGAVETIAPPANPAAPLVP